jgi:hypothetical protein
MSIVEVNWNPDRRQLQQFALLWLGFFAVVGAYCLWANGAERAAIVFWIVAAMGLVSYFVPYLLRPVYIVWMALALPVGWVISHLLLAIVFYGVFTPIGLAMRIVGYDPMTRRLDRSADSYWVPHDASDDASCYFKQY